MLFLSYILAVWCMYVCMCGVCMCGVYVCVYVWCVCMWFMYARVGNM